MTICNFCNKEIEVGTGFKLVKKDGKILNFCSSKCQKNMLKLKRVPRRVRWSKFYAKQ